MIELSISMKVWDSRNADDILMPINMMMEHMLTIY